MHKIDLALNDLKWLLCHKTRPIGYMYIAMYFLCVLDELKVDYTLAQTAVCRVSLRSALLVSVLSMSQISLFISSKNNLQLCHSKKQK